MFGNSCITVTACTYPNRSEIPKWLKLEINNSDEYELRETGRPGFGIGLKNVENRLKENYGDAHFCEFRKIDNHHYKAEIRIPLEK